MEIALRRLTPDTPIPEYKTPGAGAFDIAVIEGATLSPGERKLFRTGLVLQTPPHHVLVLVPRSSNAKKGIQLTNGVGIIDEDYCGPEDEIFLSLLNVGTEPYGVTPGERIAQGMFLQITKGSFYEPSDWNIKNNRGGFGTTG